MVQVEARDHNMAGLCGVSKSSRWKNTGPWDGLDGVGYGLINKIIVKLTKVGLLIKDLN